MDLGLGFHEIRVQFQEWGFRFQKNRVIAQAQSRPKTKTLGVLHNIFLFCVLILCPLPLWSRKPPAFSQKLCGDCTTDCTTFWKIFPEITLGSQNRWCAPLRQQMYNSMKLVNSNTNVNPRFRDSFRWMFFYNVLRDCFAQSEKSFSIHTFCCTWFQAEGGSRRLTNHLTEFGVHEKNPLVGTSICYKCAHRIGV